MEGASECIKSYSEALSSKAEFWKMIRCLRFFLFSLTFFLNSFQNQMKISEAA